jgi:wobble nucleotide-excising tRNase
MLKKFVTIKNVGRFLKYGAAGDVELKRYSLIFAENGRGKTTLCAILRSLQSGVAAHVLGRRTLGSPDAPEVRILQEAGGVLNFSNGAWSATVPEIAIFDATFVSENVFSGDTVDVAHKRSLYRVIVGKDGVKLAKEIDDLDAASRAKATEIRDKLAPLQALLPRGTSLDVFLAFAEDPVIDETIAATERELDAVRQAAEIANRATLSEVSVPALPAGFAALLGRTVEGVAEDAGKRVAAQIAAHNMGRDGEAWLGQGLGYANGADCPFCAQDLAPAATLLDVYRAYFSRTYNELRTAIAAMRNSVEAALGDRQIAAFERTIDQNATGVEFWSRFAELPALPWEAGAGEALRVLRQAAFAQLDRKAATPLESVAPDGAFATAVEGALRVSAAAAGYNEAVAVANAAIGAKKRATGAADVRTVEARLAQRRLVKKRHEPETRDAWSAYRKAVEEKAEIERQKDATKDKLDEYTRGVIGKYEQAINRLLGDFHAGFTITRTEHGYPGGVASSSYQILINGTPVELGDERTPLDQPSFRNTLSSGDKSTLALAFFLAQIEQDPERASKIVVFDDPFNSQDNFRKDHTARKIRDCGESCAQVIVLSHDPYFLKRLWERLQEKTAERKSLEFRRLGLTNTAIVEWDVEAATQGAYKADRKVLTDYYHDGIGEMRHVVQKIRPVLEYYTKILGAGALADSDTLGVIVGKIRNAGVGHQLFPHCDELDNLNVYTRRYHHGENPDAATEPINDGELHGYVRRTLELTGGC